MCLQKLAQYLAYNIYIIYDFVLLVDNITFHSLSEAVAGLGQCAMLQVAKASLCLLWSL